MSYLICELCGKHYPLPEGESSFNYDKCVCGGNLKYSPNQIKEEKKRTTAKKLNLEKNNPNNRKISWKGILVGLLFLFTSLIASVMIIFGENLPTDPTNIPMQFLTYFSILTIILTIIAGSVSAYLSGSRKYLEGALNGGLVGVILGLILGLVGGVMIFISGTIIFGLLSMAGGVIGIIPRKFSKK